MLNYAGPIRELIEQLERLPGIGPKSAQRLAFHILSSGPTRAHALADAVAAVHERMAGQRRWRRLLRVGGGVLAPLAVAALVLLGMWLRLPPETPSPGGMTIAAGGEQTFAVPVVAAAAGEALPVASDDDLWLLGVAMTDVEMDDLEEGIAQLIAGVRESSEAPATSSSQLDPGMTERRLEDFREKLMALEFELLGDM